MPVPMLNSVVRWFVPAQSGTGLVPAASYLAKFYAAGGTTPKAIYKVDGTTVYPSPSNVAVLNSEGYATLKLAAGMYKLVICLPEVTPSGTGGTPVYTEDNISGAGSFGTGFVATVIDSGTAGLKDVDPVANKFVYCAGYWAIGDGGHGMFYNKVDSSAPDGGYCITSAVDGSKRWFRIPDEDGSVRAASFGYIGSKSFDGSNYLTNASSYAYSNNVTLIIGTGNAATVGTSGQRYTLYAPEYYFEPDAVLTAAAGVTGLDLHGVVEGSVDQHFANFPAAQIFLKETQDIVRPEWFGASTGLGDNTAKFADWLASLPDGGVFILPPGTWNYANVATFPYPTNPLVLYGKITGGGGTIYTGCYFPDDSVFRMHQLKLKNGATLTDTSSSDMTASGGIIAGAGITAGGQVTAGTSVVANASVIAGFAGGAGYLQGNAGTSGFTFKAPGCIDFVGLATSFPITRSLTANVLTKAGDRLVITANILSPHSGWTTPGTIAISFGGTTIASFTSADPGSGFVWGLKLTSTITYKTSTSAVVESKLEFGFDASGTLGASADPMARHMTLGGVTVAFTSTQSLVITPAAGMTLTNMFIDYHPAP